MAVKSGGQMRMWWSRRRLNSARDPWSNFEQRHLNNMRVDMHVRIANALTRQWQRRTKRRRDRHRSPRSGSAPAARPSACLSRKTICATTARPPRLVRRRRAVAPAAATERAARPSSACSTVRPAAPARRTCALAVNRKRVRAQRKLQAESVGTRMRSSPRSCRAGVHENGDTAGAGALLSRSKRRR